MDFGFALTYIFEDKQWIGKLAPLVILMFVSVIPIFGLIAYALALGYMVQITLNVRNGHPRPLPRWSATGPMFSMGGQVLLAGIIYNLPLLLFSVCSATILSGVAGGFLQDALTLAVVCCVAPFALVYLFVMWSMLAIGISEYIETGEVSALYRPVHQFDVFRANARITREWALFATLLNVGLVVLGLIPCLGWLLVALFGLPAHGHLLGQFARKLGTTSKARPRRKHTPA